MEMFHIFAGVAYFILDLLALMSITGSALILLGSVIHAMRGRRFRAPEKLFMWSVGGLLFGISGVISLAISGQFTIEKTVLFGLNMNTVYLLFGISAVLLVAGKLLQGRVRQATMPKPRRFVRQSRQ